MKRNKKSHSEINYWQSNTDMMTGLVLVLVLIILLLILYLMQIPEEREPDAYEGDSYALDEELGDTLSGEDYGAEDYGGGDYDYGGDYSAGGYAGGGYGAGAAGGGTGGGDEGGDVEEYTETNDEGGEVEEYTEAEYDEDGGGGGGGDGTSYYEGDYEYPYAPTNGDEWGKAAVYATVIDAETGRAIREEGITFELYEEQIAGSGGTLRFLNTYYPEKTEYRDYSTTGDGTFYLPEKIDEGNYYFKQITDLEGYDSVDSVDFQVDDVYDWADPFVVSIEISPSKNIIPITMTDAETEQPISGGTFEITAAEDIRTADETVRFAKDQVADTVTIGEDGRGESEELYLGSYLISQDTIPQYYASIEGTTPVTVEKKDGGTPDAITFICEKTKISLSLSDELYTSRKLEGAEFTLTCNEYPELTQEAETDEKGELVFTNLEKSRTYELRQTSAPEGYRFDDSPIEITVSEDGRIDGEVETSLDITNYVPRVNIEVTDKIFGEPVSDLSVSLYNSDDELLQTWSTSGSAETFENLAAGSYYILLDGDEEQRYEFDFSDDEALQEFSVSIWTMENIIVIVVGCVAALGVVSIVTVILRKSVRKGKKS